MVVRIVRGRGVADVLETLNFNLKTTANSLKQVLLMHIKQHDIILLIANDGDYNAPPR
jgi:hypothetical protein